MSEKSHSNQSEQGHEDFSLTDELLQGFHDDFLDGEAIDDDLIYTELKESQPIIDLEHKDDQNRVKKEASTHPDQALKSAPKDRKTQSQNKVVKFSDRTVTDTEVDELTRNIERLEAHLKSSKGADKQTQKTPPPQAKEKVEQKKAAASTVVAKHTETQPVKKQPRREAPQTTQVKQKLVAPAETRPQQAKVTAPPTTPSQKTEKVEKVSQKKEQIETPVSQAAEPASQSITVPPSISGKQSLSMMVLTIISLAIGAGAAWFAYSATQGISGIQSSLQEIKALKGPDINQNPQFIALNDQVNDASNRIAQVSASVTTQVNETNKRIANISSVVTEQSRDINKRIASVSTVVAELENQVSSAATNQDEALTVMKDRMKQLEAVIVALESKVDTITTNSQLQVAQINRISEQVKVKPPVAIERSTTQPKLIAKPEPVQIPKTVQAVTKPKPVVSAFIKEPVAESKSVISKWVLNLLSFKHQVNANNMMAKLQKAGMENLEVIYFEKSGKHWYRVRVSGFETREEAIAVIPDLPKGFHIDSAWAGRY